MGAFIHEELFTSLHSSQNDFSTCRKHICAKPTSLSSPVGPKSGFQLTDARTMPQLCNTCYNLGLPLPSSLPSQSKDGDKSSISIRDIQSMHGDVDKNYISIGEWMWMMFILHIPFVNLIMFFVYAFSGENESRKNFYKAIIVWFLLLLGVATIVILILIGMSSARGF